ncbi:MAG: polyprenyl synthetase family protein [Lachnospiraceae bacterium]|nr:polyprenyl synthetase family protein [Lachnospiraceae bacterium]
MEFKDELKEKIKISEEILKRYLPEETGHQKTIFSAMNYSLLAGGKRIRPILMLETYKMFLKEESAYQADIIEPFVSAMEMIHTYSLVHDDLPAMDDDMYRRGKLTTHAAFGEAMGILAGDALLNFAYETAGQAFTACGEDIALYKRTTKAMNLLSYYAGVYGMVGGQVVDVEESGNPLSLEQLMFIYDLKTGALLKASMTIGAVLAGATDEEVKAIESIAEKVGLAFQIQDDILDVISTTEELGKEINSDEKNGKTTYVTLLGIDKAKEEVKTRSDKAAEELSELKKNDMFIQKLIDFLIHRTY